jgi:hypothetical protein
VIAKQVPTIYSVEINNNIFKHRRKRNSIVAQYVTEQDRGGRVQGTPGRTTYREIGLGELG